MPTTTNDLHSDLDELQRLLVDAAVAALKEPAVLVSVLRSCEQVVSRMRGRLDPPSRSETPTA